MEKELYCKDCVFFLGSVVNGRGDYCSNKVVQKIRNENEYVGGLTMDKITLCDERQIKAEVPILEDIKVYCKDCVYFEVRGNYCKHSDSEPFIDTPYKKEVNTSNYRDINRDNDCELFEQINHDPVIEDDKGLWRSAYLSYWVEDLLISAGIVALLICLIVIGIKLWIWII